MIFLQKILATDKHSSLFRCNISFKRMTLNTNIPIQTDDFIAKFLPSTNTLAYPDVTLALKEWHHVLTSLLNMVIF